MKIRQAAEHVYCIEDVFDIGVYQDIKFILKDIDWKYSQTTNPESDAVYEPGYFATQFYQYCVTNKTFIFPNADLFQTIMIPFLDFVQGNSAQARVPIRLKANLYPRTDKIFQHEKHLDYFNYETREHFPWLNSFPITNMVYMVNDNDGGTEILDTSEGDILIPSKQNTAVIFNNQFWHKSSTCTNKKARITINFNFL